MNKFVAFSGLMILLAGSAFAYENTQQRLERNVREAQYALENAAFAGKPVTADLRRTEARVKLAKAQAELEAFKTAGPASYEQGQLEGAVKVAQANVERASFDGKPVTWDARRKEAREKLAKAQAALETFKTGGPTAFERANLEKAIQHDKWVIATGGSESKMVQRAARINAARASLAQNEAALAALR